MKYNNRVTYINVHWAGDYLKIVEEVYESENIY